MRKRINWKTIKKAIGLLVLLSLLGAAVSFIFWGAVQQYYQQYFYDVESVPAGSVALVFGAGIRADGRPSSFLRDRMDTAIELYEAGKVDKLLVSGDNRFEDYDEPGTMMAYAISQGVAAADIQPDYGGRRTYDSCYRAKHIFQLDEVILVTQAYHQPRALMLCRQLGMSAVGVPSDLRARRLFVAREIGATLQAGWDLIQQEPAPVMGDPIPLVERQNP